jgi:hypothetical protein
VKSHDTKGEWQKCKNGVGTGIISGTRKKGKKRIKSI